MPTVEHVQYMHRYHQWACGRVWRNLSDISVADFIREIEGSTLRDITNHLIAATVGWTERLVHHRWPDGMPYPPDDLNPDAYVAYWKDREAELDAFIDNLNPTSALVDVEYDNLPGRFFSHPTCEVLLQVFNHATYHRGQYMMQVRRLGLPTVQTDLIAMLWERDSKD
jgi:uncharacterized damage-inducible protein DinB